MKINVRLSELKNEIDLIRKRYPVFKDDSAFVFWFLHAYLTDKEETAKNALTGKEGGRGGEKNIDAIFIDERSKQCNIIQGKFRVADNATEKRNDVLCFVDIGELVWGDSPRLEAFYSELDPLALGKFKEVVASVRGKNYELNLYYVTTGKCTNTIINEAKEKTRLAQGKVNIYVLTKPDILRTFQDYLDDITPHIPPLRLRIVSESVIQHEGLIHRFDPETKIESWVLSACGKDIGQMYLDVGKKLFAKNIRGWLGKKTDINYSIAETIKKEPDNFWYYNNGITIVCDDVKRETQADQDVIIIEGAQIINGQQTTRTLQENDSKNTSVLVKIIKIPRNFEDGGDYDALVNSIVRATNWQNRIEPSDLVSNDYIQVFLEKELRKIGYQYIRKRMSKSEAKTWYGQGFQQISKVELAQAVAACLFDPNVVTTGKEILFEDPYYKTIFSSRELLFYLVKYWVMRQVKNVARRDRERQLAKWLVLNFAWYKLENCIGSGRLGKQFCEECNGGVYGTLGDIIDRIFKSAINFYRLNCGKGEEKIEVRNFFRLSKLNQKFREYWVSPSNRYGYKVEEYIERFKNSLRNENEK